MEYPGQPKTYTMSAIKTELASPMHAVNGWKQKEFVAAQAAVLRIALTHDHFSPADLPENSTLPEHRQGVASNAWNSLTALNIIQRVPMSLTVPAKKIYGGRTMNTNPSAKGRWCSVYHLASRSLALAWLERHGVPVTVPAAPVQTNLALA